MVDSPLPIDALRSAFDALTGPVVITAPTGSGKSSRVPTWCEAPVLVVEPRRVAARSLATWLAGPQLGRDVGYIVRGERRAGPQTPIVYVTTGVALRILADTERRFRTVILDEFHERSLDLDLLLALVPGRARLVVLSATIEGDRVAEHIGGRHLQGEGRTFPVEVRYTHADRTLPDADGLADRVRKALLSVADEPGDRLVFVPGKAEIERVCREVGDLGEVLPLHGGLPLAEQSRVFKTTGPQRIVVATNVAETSVTLPRTRVVIDTGLVRRTRYKNDRGYLTLLPIAMDSAEQRAGRAGRTAPGIALRLWGQRALLRERTPPELHRESLVPLVLAAAAAGHPLLDLPFLDTPPEHAVQTARAHLLSLEAIDTSHAITERGRRLFGLPLDARHGRLLIEGELRNMASRMVDLVAVLSMGRDLFEAGPRPGDDLRAEGCDVTGLLRAMELGDAKTHGLHGWVLREARKAARRLRQALDVPEGYRPLDRNAVAQTLMAAWPDCVHVVRRRKRKVAWSNGGTEIELGRRSAVDEDKVDVVAVVGSMALGHGKDVVLIATCAMPLQSSWVVEAGIGRDRLASVAMARGAAVGCVERVHAGYLLDSRETPLSGELAREAVRLLFLRGTLFKKGAAEARRRFAAGALAAALDSEPLPWPDLETWVTERVASLGIERGEDVLLLSRDDLMPDLLPTHRMEALARVFPRELKMGTLRFAVEPEPRARRVTLHNLGARIKTLPPTTWLPKFQGWAVRIEDRGTHRWLRR
ncbi:MAG: ATP-dependent RNA helicase [Rhodobacterales bacterium]|nr:ATP-dependent RNA helicase [Rhodobacterales bacterium]